MSILKLAEDLKDVPEHFLVSEVRQPTGSYPGYLVVAELERRKGMRERHMEEAPKSTVVDDLSQPSREQIMAAVAQMQQPGAAPQLPSYRQQPLPPQMPPQLPLPPQIPQMRPAGLMATPQASSLAATDAVASPRKRMAGGGLVAFQEGGDVKRFDGRDGSLVYDPTPYDTLTKSQDQAAADVKKKNDKIAADRAAFLASASTALPGGELTPSNERYQNVMNARKDENLAQIQRNIMDAALGTNKNEPLIVGKAPRSSAGKAASAATLPVSSQQQMAFPTAPTDEQLAAAGQKAIGMFGQNVPQRFSETEKEIGRRTQNLKDRRKSALNEALMMAGIGVLKSKSPGRYFGEGAEEGMLAYRQSMKDVRGGEDLMTDAKQSLAHQQLLQDLAQQKIGQDAQQRTLDMYRYGSDAGYQQGQLLNTQEQIRQSGLKLPAEITALISGAQKDIEMGKYYGQFGGAAGIRAADIDPRILIEAQRLASMELINQKDKPGYAEKLRDLTNSFISNMNQNGMPGVPGQPQVANRNQQGQPLGG